jgi:hypothetical protein
MKEYKAGRWKARSCGVYAQDETIVRVHRDFWDEILVRSLHVSENFA